MFWVLTVYGASMAMRGFMGGMEKSMFLFCE